MENLPEQNITHHGVKCDSEDCTFLVEFSDFNEYEKYINKPCPICGENLLSESDYELVKTFHLLATDEEFAKDFHEQNPLTQLPPEIAEMIAKLEEPSAQATIRVEFVDGVPKMTSSEPEVQAIIDAVEKHVASLEQQ